MAAVMPVEKVMVMQEEIDRHAVGNYSLIDRGLNL